MKQDGCPVDFEARRSRRLRWVAGPTAYDCKFKSGENLLIDKVGSKTTFSNSQGLYWRKGVVLPSDQPRQVTTKHIVWVCPAGSQVQAESDGIQPGNATEVIRIQPGTLPEGSDHKPEASCLRREDQPGFKMETFQQLEVENHCPSNWK